MRRLLPLVPLLAMVGLACFVSFDPNGQPCAPDGGCLSGYACKAGKCVSGAVVGTGAGGATGASGSTTSGGTSGSTGSGDAGCTAASCGAQRCLPASGQCAPRDCAHTICPLAQICQPQDGGVACVDRDLLASSHPCASDAECVAPYQCLLPGGTATASATPNGLCSRTCTPGADAGCDGTDVCTPLTNGRGVATALCLPVSPPRACGVDTPCRDYGLGCAYFDFTQGTDGLLPVSFCDATDAGAANTPCTSATDCRSRACVGSLCAATCAADADCGTGRFCRISRATGLTFNTRVCLSGAATRCATCTSSATCLGDSNLCDLATHACNLGCRPGEVEPCGAGSSCGPTGSCVFDGGACH